jgi:hypothetical protein
MKTRLAVFATLAAFAALCPTIIPMRGAEPATESSPAFRLLDGKTYKVRMWEKAAGKDKAEADTLIFAKGTFRSTGCDPYGFPASAYRARVNGKRIVFDCTATSPQEGVMEWSGAVTEGKLEGTAVWTKKDQKPVAYVFEGSAD